MKLTALKPRIGTLKSNLRTTSGSWRASGMTTAERGYGHKWQKARERFLTARPLCCYCERKGYVTLATVVDHKTPHQGNEALFWDESNWQPLCKACHDSTKRREEGR